MSFYERRILPRLLDLVMRQRRTEPYRRRAVSAARGVVLEIGLGSGLNLPHYGPDVERVHGLDPSAELLGIAKSRLAGSAAPVLLLRAVAEMLPIRARSIDTVVMTWTLCSIADPAVALLEMRRVLKPDARLIFVEHGLSPEPRVRRWQNRLTPCWRRIAGGCHLNRKADELIRAAGFAIGELGTGYMKGPKPMTFIYEGAARAGPS